MLVLIYLVELPLATVLSIGWGVIPLSFFANMVYFLIDMTAAQMEEPFGSDDNDVPIEKMIRRIDKHTAAQARTARTHARTHPSLRRASEPNHGRPPPALCQAMLAPRLPHVIPMPPHPLPVRSY